MTKDEAYKEYQRVTKLSEDVLTILLKNGITPLSLLHNHLFKQINHRLLEDVQFTADRWEAYKKGVS